MFCNKQACVQLENLNRTHPGAEEELQNRGLSVCRNNINVRQSIDGACEQTFMKSSKTACGIKNFIKQDSIYEKWVLTRPFHAKYVDALLTYANLNRQENDAGKCLRESQIKESEENALHIVNVMKTDFINPFSTDLDPNKLCNLASGFLLPDDISKGLLSIHVMRIENQCKTSLTHVLMQNLQNQNFSLVLSNELSGGDSEMRARK